MRRKSIVQLVSSRPDRRRRPTKFKQLGLALPAPLSARLDGLVVLADEAGLRSSRTELVSALIHATDESEEKLQDYRAALGTDAVMDGHELWQYVTPLRTKGPRPMQAGGPGEQPRTEGSADSAAARDVAAGVLASRLRR